MTSVLQDLILTLRNLSLSSADISLSDGINVSYNSKASNLVSFLSIDPELLDFMIQINAQFDTSGDNLQIVTPSGPVLLRKSNGVMSIQLVNSNSFIFPKIPERLPEGITFNNFLITIKGHVYYKRKIKIPRIHKSVYFLGDLTISYKALELMTTSRSYWIEVRDQLKRLKLTKTSDEKVSITASTKEGEENTGRYFIAKVVNGLPQFSNSPRPQDSINSAKKEIRRLKVKHPEVEFKIYPELSYGIKYPKVSVNYTKEEYHFVETTVNGML